MNIEKVRKVLITGGAGFVGINIVERLLKTSQFKISIIDNLSSGNYRLLEKTVKVSGAEIENVFSAETGKVSFFHEDITNKESVSQLLKGQDLVIHLAAQTGVIPSIRDPRNDARINIEGTLNLLSASVDSGVENFIFASSAAPLGEQVPPLDENKIPRPLSPYGASKAAAEAYCSAFSASYGLGTVALRFSNLYGPYSFHKGSVIAAFMKEMKQGRTLTVYGDGEQTRDFLYTRDLSDAVLRILNCDSSKLKGQLFQMGTGVETSINHLIELLKSVTGIETNVQYVPERKGEIKRNYASVKKFKAFSGFEPETGLETGLRETWNWFCEYESEKADNND
jgi:UDP-glucose 4-epimerase